jgi:hypothetical protein
MAKKDKEKIEDTKDVIKAVNLRRTDNTMAKSKRKKAQLVIYKTLHRILLQIDTFYYSPKYLKGHVKWLRLKVSWISIYQCNQCLSPQKLMS